MNHEETIFHAQNKTISIRNKQLCVDDKRYSIKDISVVSVSDKNKPLWPGITLAAWAGVVFYNDSLPRTYGIEPNNPLFKWAIVSCACAYFYWWFKQPTKHEVMITVNGEEESLAIYDDKLSADKLADAISSEIKL